MTKITYTNEMPYKFNNERRGSKYYIGEAWKNHGEFLESAVKYHLGLDYLVNPATSYDNGSDIESLSASVKSSGASLACIYADTKEEILETYFKNVASNLWIWVVDIDNEITEYHMNRAEFKKFCDKWSGLARESGKVLRYKLRFKSSSATMIRWLEEQI